MLKGTLRYAVVVGVEVELEGLAQLCRTGEPCLRHQVADAPVETLDHAVGLGDGKVGKADARWPTPCRRDQRHARQKLVCQCWESGR